MKRRPPVRSLSPLLAPRGALAVVGPALVVIVGLAALAPGCRTGKLTPEECTEMLDRYVDMSLEGEPAFGDLSALQLEAAREMKRAVKRAEKSYRRVHDQCQAEVRREEYRCAVRAKTPNDWEACID